MTRGDAVARNEGAGAPLPGAFLVLEGPEGAGKSTQVDLLAAHLVREGHDVQVTREPGGTPAAQRIRDVILDPRLRIDPLPEFLLYAAARAQHVAERILPALRQGRVVVCDRFAGSSVAYQGHGRGLDLDFIRSLNARATSGVEPDAVVLLDLPVEAGLARIAARGSTDRLERADADFHERVRQGFLSEAANPRGVRWTVLDATQDAQVVADAVWRAVRPALPVPHRAGR